MLCSKQVSYFLCALFALFLMVTASPDSAGSPPLPGPGLSYGGIPYGSVSGNVAEFFKRKTPSGGRGVNVLSLSSKKNVDYSPIEQWLR